MEVIFMDIFSEDVKFHERDISDDVDKTSMSYPISILKNLGGGIEENSVMELEIDRKV
jgi:hypothetical protein